MLLGRWLAPSLRQPSNTCHPASNPDVASCIQASLPPVVLHQTGMRDLDFLDGKGSDEISGFQLWQSRPSALSAFALSAVGPCQQNPNLNVTSHPLHLAACHHRPSFFHPSFFGPPLAGLQALFTCFRFRVAARRALEAASIFPLRSTLPRLLAVPFFVRPKVGTKRNQASSQHARLTHTPSHFHSQVG